MERDVSVDMLLQSFPALAAEECEELYAYLELQKFPKDATLMRQGDAGDCMGIVLEGSLAVKKETAFPGKFVLIAILEKGAMVGEIAIADKTRRTASVVAMEDSALLILSNKNANILFREKPAIGVKMLRRILKVVGGRLQLASARLAELL